MGISINRIFQIGCTELDLIYGNQFRSSISGPTGLEPSKLMFVNFAHYGKRQRHVKIMLAKKILGTEVKNVGCFDP
jgi:hypothetical protein